MSDAVTARLDAVSVRYRMARLRRPSIKEFTIRWAVGSLSYQPFWGLRHVSLALRRGEALGVVGRNGAGKSTLLKVLSGVLEPTEGRATLPPRTAVIQEPGTAFDRELSGIENAYLAALLMGRSRREADERIDEIVAFSGLGEFVNSPIRNYSAGMAARLAFAVATAWPLDLLLIDEVLAVNDADFSARCTAKIEELREAGTSLVVVSHQPDSLRKVCERCVWMESGQVQAEGQLDEILEAYADKPGAHQMSLERGR